VPKAEIYAAFVGALVDDRGRENLAHGIHLPGVFHGFDLRPLLGAADRIVVAREHGLQIRVLAGWRDLGLVLVLVRFRSSIGAGGSLRLGRRFRGGGFLGFRRLFGRGLG